MTQIRIPTTLRNLTGGEKIVAVTAEEETFESVLEALEANHAGFKARLLSDDGELTKQVNLYLNDEDLRYLGGLAATVTATDEVSIIPAVAGGSEAVNVTI